MKVRMTIDVPDNARLYIGSMDRAEIDRSAMATRDGIRSFMQRYVIALAEDASALSPGPLTESEVKEAREAVDYLRAQGKRDHEIRAWLFMQRARLHLSYATMGDQMDIELFQDGGARS